MYNTNQFGSGIVVQTSTNFQTYVIHEVTWGYRNKPIFIQKTKEVRRKSLDVLNPTTDTTHFNQSWIEELPLNSNTNPSPNSNPNPSPNSNPSPNTIPSPSES
jgi:hypothetical protein